MVPGERILSTSYALCAPEYSAEVLTRYAIFAIDVYGQSEPIQSYTADQVQIGQMIQVLLAGSVIGSISIVLFPFRLPEESKVQMNEAGYRNTLFGQQTAPPVSHRTNH